MKTFYLTAAAVIAATVTSYAQPTLTDVNTNPQIGDKVILHISNYTSPGTGGTNQNWNFSSLPSNAVDTQFVDNSSNSAYSASFPNATYYMYSSSSTDEGFYNSNSSVQQIVGLYSAGTGTSPYTDPQDALRFPFQYQNTFADSFSTYFTSGVTIYRNGEAVVTADGYGSVTLPYGTLNGVLRVETIQDYTDSSSFSTTVGKTTSYHWYKPGVRYPVLMLATLQYGTNTVQQCWYLDQSVVGINNNDASENPHVNIYPNPAQNSLQLQFKLPSTSDVSLSIFDARGKVVLHEDYGKIPGGQNKLTANIESLQTGMYFLKIKTETGIITERFIKH